MPFYINWTEHNIIPIIFYMYAIACAVHLNWRITCNLMVVFVWSSLSLANVESISSDGTANDGSC